MEECAFITDYNFEYAHKLDPAMPNGEENGVQSQIGEAKKSGNQSGKVTWLNKGEINVQIGLGLEAEDLS
jgi:hypothetical protein